jgi:Fur family transcriptional regulator, peroxide stress response regulator
MMEKEVLDQFRQAGMRVTPQRIAIFELLNRSVGHPTANDIYEKLKENYPSMSLATVYNTLDVLVAMGLVSALGNVGDDRVHFDGNTKTHINLACVRCHKIIDVESTYLDGLNAEVVKDSGYEIQGSRILYFGICPDCKEKT